MTAAEPSIAELSRQVAEAKGWKEVNCTNSRCLQPHWERASRRTIHVHPDYSEPEQLFALEGELLKAGWALNYWLSLDQWSAQPLNVTKRELTEPGTPEGRARLILRATLEMNGGKVV